MSDKNGNLGQSTFTSLVLSLSSTAWIGLGKIADPITGKIKMDLNNAKFSIDTLIMLRDKTRGNLTEDEQRLLNGVIADLQANYAETVFSSDKESDKKESETKDKSAKVSDNKKDETKIKTESNASEVKKESRTEEGKKDTGAGKNEGIKRNTEASKKNEDKNK